MLRKQVVLTLYALVLLSTSMWGDSPISRTSLRGALIVVGKDEPSYVQYAAEDLAKYVYELSGKEARVSKRADDVRKSGIVIVVGFTMASAVGVDHDLLDSVRHLSDQGFVIRTISHADATWVVVAGQSPHGTNFGIATLMQMMRSENGSVYLPAGINLKEEPAVRVRGLHMNGGWQLNYPYGFLTWKEEDWKKFVDIAWSQRAKVIFIWPYVETMVVPLAPEDEAYLQEFRRITDYAQQQRGMEVWIMQSANRVALSNCGVEDPRLRPHWVDGCQKDMNPADPQQFSKIEKSFEALYKIVNNADGFCMIDSDPGGWPQSPLIDQLKIFLAARNLLDRYNVREKRAKLVDWMWIGWGRHKFFTTAEHLVTAFDWGESNPDASDIEFMAQTINNFKRHLPEPWEIVAGMAPYLESSRRESTLEKTVFLPYGTIEMEPAFPSTNVELQPVRSTLQTLVTHPQLRGWMGNNELLLLQFPRTFFFLNSLWDADYRKQDQAEVLREVSRHLYPEYSDLLRDCFLALREKDSNKLRETLARLQQSDLTHRSPQLGAIGRHLFPTAAGLPRIVEMQLRIRLARQELIDALQGSPDIGECETYLEKYFSALLDWNKETGWEKTINIGIWTLPIYEVDRDLEHGMSRLKRILGGKSPHTSYSQVASFFDGISTKLVQKYDKDSVLLGCTEPFKLAVAQRQ